MTQLYSIRRMKSPGEFAMTKFDSDFNHEVTYVVSRSACSAPDGHRPKCKHRTMLALFEAAKHTDDGWFLDWDTRMWRPPLVDAEAELADPLTLDNSSAEEAISPAFESESSNRVLAAVSHPATPTAVKPPPAGPSGAASPPAGGAQFRLLKIKP